MSDHVVLYVDRLMRRESVQEKADVAVMAESSGSSADGAVTAESSGSSGGGGDGGAENETRPSCSAGNAGKEEGGEDEPLIQVGECRICQDEDSFNNLETPCACSGSLKFAHRVCVQHWCNEKGDITCEICHQEYQPNYIAPPVPPCLEETAIEIGGGWTISGTPLNLRDPRLLAIAEAERHFLEVEYEHDSSNASGAAFCRSAALILMALLLLRHALAIPDSNGEDDVSTFFSLFLLRAAGFLLPCYIMAWAINILHRRRQRQEAAALAATQIAFVLQSGHRQGLQFAVTSGSNHTTTQPQPQPQENV